MKRHWVEMIVVVLLFAASIVAGGEAQMAWIGALISGLTAIGGAVANGVMSNNAANEADRKERERERMRMKYIERQLKEENEDYAANINEDAMYRYTAQYNANKLSDALREQLKNARGRQAVMGGTDEAIAAQMENNANAMSDYYGQVEMVEEERKKALKEAHKERKRELDAAAADVQDQAMARQAQRDLQRGQNIASAVGSGISAVGSIATGLDTRSIKYNGGSVSPYNAATSAADEKMIQTQAYNNGVQGERFDNWAKTKFPTTGINVNEIKHTS